MRVNATLAEMDGVPQHEYTGRPLEDVLPALAGRLDPMLRRALE